MRKCGYDAIDAIAPAKYKGFVKNITEVNSLIVSKIVQSLY